MTRGALTGVRIIVTRPAHQAENLCQLLEAEGAETARLPLFAIESLEGAEQQRAVFDEHRGDQGWIFTSANAVARAAELDTGAWPALYAVGSATAAALDRAGRPGAVVPPGAASSEALLDLPVLQQIETQRYLIVTGENGRDAIAEGLSKRGAKVTTLPLYRRRPLTPEPARIEAELEQADVIVLTSGEALDLLWTQTPIRSRPRLLRQQLLVPSLRVVENALARGFLTPLVPETVSDEAILRCLLQWRAGRARDKTMTPNGPEIPAPPLPPPGAATPKPAIVIPPAPAAAPPRKAASSVVAWLLVLVLAGALGYGGWLLWDLRQNQEALIRAQDDALRRLAHQTEDLTSLGAELNTRQSDVARIVERQGTDLSGLQGRLDNSEKLMGRISDELGGGRGRFALASVEQLLLLASDRLLLNHDVRSALLALEIADQRLALLNDPRLFRVREAIATERSRLQALPRPDLTSVSLTLSALIDRADSLPLRARATPRNYGALNRSHADNARSEAHLPAWKRAWHSIENAVASLFVIRRDARASSLRLLPAEDEAVIGHVLILKLESARIAMLRGETAAFRAALASAADWLRQFFATDEDVVSNALIELDRLQALELSAPAPDISGSLGLLRQQLDGATSKTPDP